MSCWILCSRQGLKREHQSRHVPLPTSVNRNNQMTRPAEVPAEFTVRYPTSSGVPGIISQ